MPLGIMAPFMGYQSAALAYNFGLNYEFGKRVIKSMSNEKFNKIAEDPILLNELTSRHHDVLLKAFINEVPKVDKIQDLIIKKMVELEFAKIKVMPELIAQIPKGFIEGIFNLGNTGEVPPPPPPGGKPPPGGEDPKTKTKPKTESDISGLKNFSNINTVIQAKILEYMRGISTFDKQQQASAQNRKPIYKSRILNLVKLWKRFYVKVGGYVNPIPYDAMPWLSSTTRAYLRDWHRLL